MSRTRDKKVEQIKNLLGDEIEIYKKFVHLQYNGNVFKGLCPFHKEVSPSFTVFENGRYYCFGCGKNGPNVVEFISQIRKISFESAFKLVENDLETIEKQYEERVKRVVVKSDNLIEFDDMLFTLKHAKYWDKYLLPERFLRKRNVFAVKKLAFNKKVKKIDSDTIVFAYYAEDIDRVKLLFIGPKVKKEDKWKNNVPNIYLWNFPKTHQEELWIMKSRKDGLCMEFHFGKSHTDLQNESAAILLNNNLTKLNSISNKNILCLGSDKQARGEEKIIKKYTDWDSFYTPPNLLDRGVQDISDYISKFGVDSLENLLIKRNLI